jgi:hypothetical protein
MLLKAKTDAERCFLADLHQVAVTGKRPHVKAYAVNRAVNSVKNDTEECIEHRCGLIPTLTTRRASRGGLCRGSGAGAPPKEGHHS